MTTDGNKLSLQQDEATPAMIGLSYRAASSTSNLGPQRQFDVCILPNTVTAFAHPDFGYTQL